MLTKHRIAVGALALALVLSLTRCTSTRTKMAEPGVQAFTMFSQAGNAAIQSIRGARLAIFNGNLTTAKQLLDKAKASVENAAKEAPTFDTTTTMSVQGRVVGSEDQKMRAGLVPVDGQVVVADDFVLTPEKQAHIDKANEHLKKGETKQALAELRLADIDVNYSRVWMPIAGSQNHLDEAIKLVNDGKYYEANLALKAIEDSLTTDSVTLAEVPKKQP